MVRSFCIVNEFSKSPKVESDTPEVGDCFGAVDPPGGPGVNPPASRYPVADPHGGRVPATLGPHAPEAGAEGLQTRSRGCGRMAGNDVSRDRAAGGGGGWRDPLGG